uniref:Uncharacterized protein n=1 Tax=Rangifer tarandus platyrhynchus TaxID=3082113 RepID=A0ACB0F262_RANTA|nr:unnamed protein product [Rangifer tarandus platyrhynchus]
MGPRRHCPSQAAGRHLERQPAGELRASLLQRRAGPPLELEPGSQPSQQGLLLTSRKDSIMRFWDVSGVAPRPSRKLSTVGLIQTDSRQANSLAQAAEDDCTPRLPQERPLLTLQRRSLSQKGWLALQAGGCPCDVHVRYALAVHVTRSRGGGGRRRRGRGWVPRCCACATGWALVVLEAQSRPGPHLCTARGLGAGAGRTRCAHLVGGAAHQLFTWWPTSVVICTGWHRLHLLAWPAKTADICLAYLPDLNNVLIFSVPGLRHQVNYSGSRKEDTPASAPVSSSATARFCLISPRELECFSLSIQNVTEPLGSLDSSWPHDASCRLPELPKLRQANRTPGIVFALTELQWKP